MVDEMPLQRSFSKFLHVVRITIISPVLQFYISPPLSYI